MASPQDYTTAVAAVITSDIAQSTTLPDGRVVWVFGDTTSVDHVPTVGPYGYPHDALAVQASVSEPKLTMLHGSYGFGWQQVPNWPGGDYFWPGFPLVDAGHLYVVGERIRGVNPFRVIGDYAAVFDLPTLRYAGLVELPFPGGDVWADAAAGPGGWWLVGTHWSGNPSYTGRLVGDVAWVPDGGFGSPARWAVSGTDVFGLVPIGSSVAIERVGSHWVGVTEVYSTGIVEVLWAPRPVGPWFVTAQTAAPLADGSDASYGAALHPEQPAPAGEVLACVSENGTTYGPRFLYVQTQPT